MGNQGGKALKWLPAHFKFERRNAPKSKRDRPSTLRDWLPCSPIQRGGGRRSRPGANPFISVLTVARCPAIFPGVWPQLRDTLSTSQSVGRRTGAFIYALSAVENRPALAAPRHTSTALFSCRFKCPCPPRRQWHFHGNADRAYNTLPLRQHPGRPHAVPRRHRRQKDPSAEIPQDDEHGSRHGRLLPSLHLPPEKDGRPAGRLSPRAVNLPFSRASRVIPHLHTNAQAAAQCGRLCVLPPAAPSKIREWLSFH